ncbi:MAG: hypothetical protein H7326_06895 [Bdellovibrionaceae bacterium]|nr:hypothetical protein [Pseudobdellovibrionaceae bacterium]
MGYSYEGVAFNLYAKPQAGGTTLYRCMAKIGGFHFGSPDAACEGSRGEGAYGYLRKEGAGAGAVLYRSLQRTSGDHLLITNPTEAKSNGYAIESELGNTAP